MLWKSWYCGVPHMSLQDRGSGVLGDGGSQLRLCTQILLLKSLTQSCIALAGAAHTQRRVSVEMEGPTAPWASAATSAVYLQS